MAAGDVSAGTAVRLGGAALFAAVVAAGAPSVGVPALLLLSIALLLGAAYTIPPLEWKRRPGVDLLAQGAGYGVVAFLLGASTSAPLGPFTLPLVAASLPYAWGVVSVGIVTMLADREGDALAGQRTTVVAWGASRSAAAAAGIALLAAVSGFALRSWVPALGGLLAAGLVLFASPLARPAASQTEERSAWNRVAILTQLAFLLLLAFRSPAALVAAVGIAAASAIHERRRGGAGYPFRADEVEREPVG
jgi:4-hydroxybenzoate polyprenyltransferase